MAIWDRLRSVFFGGAIGAAASKAIEPALEPAKQEAWLSNAVKVLDVGTAAQLAARGIAPVGQLEDEAARTGYDPNRLLALVQLSQSYPGLGELDRLSNRELIGDPEIDLALSRHGYPASWHGPLKALFNDLLSAADVAMAVQQGHLPNPGILPNISAAVTPAQGAVPPLVPDQQPPSQVPLTQIDIDPIAEAAGGGIDLQRLEVMANLAGLPPGSELLLQMWNRGLIDETTVDAGIREGHLKTKWAGPFKRLRWAVLSAAEYANLHLRGWIDQPTMYAGGASTGHTTDQMDLLFLNRGRPVSPTQAYTAWARAAPHPVGPSIPDRPGTFDYADFKRAIQQSDIRPEWIDVLWHNRYAYPSLFQLGRLAQAGALPEARVREILTYGRYEPQDIDALANYWYRGGSSSSAASHVTKAQTQLWNAVHRSYIAGELDAAQADTQLTPVVPDAAERAQVLDLWTKEQAATVKPLTASQVRKAYRDGLFDQQTAIGRLVALHFTLADAQTYLAE